MSYLEFQTEEKSVQLIPEDLEILSEYSWNMAGYTSRFGFFYQGNENADIDGLTKWQAEHIFQLTPMPPGMEDELQNKENRFRTRVGCVAAARWGCDIPLAPPVMQLHY